MLSTTNKPCPHELAASSVLSCGHHGSASCLPLVDISYPRILRHGSFSSLKTLPLVCVCACTCWGVLVCSPVPVHVVPRGQCQRSLLCLPFRGKVSLIWLGLLARELQDCEHMVRLLCCALGTGLGLLCLHSRPFTCRASSSALCLRVFCC